MASRVKEDERNERIIRGLLKLPANKRCINCNNLEPQYVCTNFSTFVCTNCTGAHREFTHRVKSISMAKFTAQEVTALQEGGNERAREVFFKEWDAHRNAYPDSSNADKLRNFIKHVYVERRYTGERSADRPPRGRDDKDEYSENRKSDGNWSGSRSPPNGSYSDRRSEADIDGEEGDDNDDVHLHVPYDGSPVTSGSLKRASSTSTTGTSLSKKSKSHMIRIFQNFFDHNTQVAKKKLSFLERQAAGKKKKKEQEESDLATVKNLALAAGVELGSAEHLAIGYLSKDDIMRYWFLDCETNEERLQFIRRYMKHNKIE